MAQVIDGELFSPLNAGSLGKGDTIFATRRIIRITSHPEHWAKNGVRYVTVNGDSYIEGGTIEHNEVIFRINRPVPRLIGGRSGGQI